MFFFKAMLPALVILAVPPPTEACEKDPRVDTVATVWLQHQPQQSLADLSPDDALCFRQNLMQQLSTSLGPVIGYKVGVYTPAARKTYNTTRPAVGVLLKRMILKSGAKVSATSGVALLSEADFLLVVKDAGINKATTREEAYRHLRGFRAFVEVPDLNFTPTPAPIFSQLIALNMSARWGVMGKEVVLPQTPAGFAGLSALSVEVTVEGAAEGTPHARGVARETLGDPIEIVLAARDNLRLEGVALKAGDLISIGTITPPRPVKAGETQSIRYSVPPSTAEVTVRFVP